MKAAETSVFVRRAKHASEADALLGEALILEVPKMQLNEANFLSDGSTE
jgi:hypothetical protein